MLITGCSVRFTLNGASVPSDLKTYTVQYFENRAPLINPLLSQSFTESLKGRIAQESRLELIDVDADVDFSGQITGYNVRPMAIQADAVSALTRLTIKVKVKYKNFKSPKDNWESTFSGFQDYPSEQNLNEVEAELSQLIIDQITEDIFNKAFSDW